MLFMSTFSSECQLDPSDVYRSLEPQSALGRPFAPFRKKRAKDGGKAYVDSTDAGRSVSGQVMPDTNPARRTAFRSTSESVRHATGSLSGITPNAVSLQPRFLSVMVRNAHLAHPQDHNRINPLRSAEVQINICRFTTPEIEILMEVIVDK
jgi:hypothetical protein